MTNELVSNIVADIKNGAAAAVNFYSADSAAVGLLAKETEEELKDIVVSFDISEFETFEDFVRTFILQLMLRDDFPEDCRVEESAIDEASFRLLRRHTTRLLVSYGNNGSRICLILNHFESADGYWDDGAFAWMRELIDSGKIPACIIFSDKALVDISEKPEGSSPLYNIFRSYSLEAGEA